MHYPCHVLHTTVSFMYSVVMQEGMTANLHEWYVGVYSILEENCHLIMRLDSMSQLVYELVQKGYHATLALLSYIIMEYVDKNHWHQFLFLYSLKAEGLLTKYTCEISRGIPVFSSTKYAVSITLKEWKHGCLCILLPYHLHICPNE